MIEQKLDRLTDAVVQLSIQIRELTDLYIGAIEVGDISGLIPAAVKLRNRRKDKNSEFREYSLLDARSIFMEYHRTFGELEAEKFLEKFGITTVTMINDEDVNRFVYELKYALSEKAEE